MSNPYEELERVFHEPNRLAIVTEVSGHVSGVVFSELRDRCGLTDGNLSRHLAALEKAGVVRIEKSFVGAKPRTTVFLTDEGRESFLSYLAALSEVLKSAAARAKKPKSIAALVSRRPKPA